jgi:hypothetical protein
MDMLNKPKTTGTYVEHQALALAAAITAVAK